MHALTHDMLCRFLYFPCARCRCCVSSRCSPPRLSLCLDLQVQAWLGCLCL
jgi:hypothetical protein